MWRTFRVLPREISTVLRESGAGQREIDVERCGEVSIRHSRPVAPAEGANDEWRRLSSEE